MPTEFTYGVYLRPDAATCRAVGELTDVVRRQFGLVSASAFPPHVTLVGAWSSAVAESARETVQVVVDGSLDRVDVEHYGAATSDYTPVLDHDRRSPRGNFADYDAPRFSAHISLASHDLQERPELCDEVEAFIRDLTDVVPSGFTGEVVSLYRLHSADWEGPWWEDLSWRLLQSWTLGAVTG